MTTQAIASIFLTVSYAGLYIQLIGLIRLVRHSPPLEQRASYAHRGLVRTASCRVAASIVYIWIGSNALVFHIQVAEATLASFCVIQVMWMVNSRFDVALKRQIDSVCPLVLPVPPAPTSVPAPDSPVPTPEGSPLMATVLDFSSGVPSAAAIKAAGYVGTVRYLHKRNPSGVHVLTSGEYADDKAHGVGVACVYEDTSPNRMLGGESAGKIDAAWARDQAKAAGITDLACVYFACDFDIQPGQYSAGDAYLRGAASVLGVSKVGTYGGYAWVTHCRANGLATWLWQTGAWSHGLVANGIHIYQHIGTVYVSGVPCDYSTVYSADYGQHPRTTVTPVTPPVVPPTPPAPPTPDWFDMATKDDLKAVVTDVLNSERESYAKRTTSYVRANGLMSVRQHQDSQGEQIQQLTADVAALTALVKRLVPKGAEEASLEAPASEELEAPKDDSAVSDAESEGLPPVPETPAEPVQMVSGAVNV